MMLASVASAQVPPPRISLECLVAQKCVQEIGWGHWDECTVIYVSLWNRAAHTHSALRRHVERYAHARGEHPRAWIAELNDAFLQPAHWPHGLPWEPRPPNPGYRTSWRAEVLHAGELLAGHTDNHCHLKGGDPDVHLEPWDWADRDADEVVARYYAEYPNAIEIECAVDGQEFLNRFFRPWP